MLARVRAQQEAQDKANAALQASKAATVAMLIPDAKVDWSKFRYAATVSMLAPGAVVFFFFPRITGELSTLRQATKVPNEPSLRHNNDSENVSPSDQSMAYNPRKGQAGCFGAMTTSHERKAGRVMTHLCHVLTRPSPGRLPMLTSPCPRGMGELPPPKRVLAVLAAGTVHPLLLLFWVSCLNVAVIPASGCMHRR